MPQSCKSRILIQNVKFNFFDNLNLTFLKQKTGLIGRNGCGKSTLLRLILGKVIPEAGKICVDGQLHYLPQQPDSVDNTLSGGEITRLLLAKAFASQADFLLLDEPTNHLDQNGKQQLYKQIKNWHSGLIIAIHDRELLNVMDEIIELTQLGLFCYGGNYESYLLQKNNETASKIRQLDDAKKYLQKTKHTIQSSYEKHAHKQSYGRALRRNGSIDKMSANSKQGRSERSQAKMLIKNNRMIDSAKSQLISIREKIELTQEIHIALPNTYIPNGKIILEIANLNFSYSETSHKIIQNFNLIIQGPQRIALKGKNGSGKSTLLRLISGQLIPQSGSITLGTHKISYLDQQANQLNPTLSVLDNFLQFNPDATPTEAYFALAQFLFRNTAAQKMVGQLSGGEKLRALLACLLMSPHPPQLLLLDEPTNHLDLPSIQQIESALKHYQGAMIVISHDQAFLKNLECLDDAVQF
jgi:ATPase subunit of ABC transporter with duplicated ATPase domains